jgi:hypothetical protein
VDPAGKVVFGVQFGALEYRTFRMPDMYTAPEDDLHNLTIGPITSRR